MSIQRRRFLAELSALAAAGPIAARAQPRPPGASDRAVRSFQIRLDAARAERDAPAAAERANGDEEAYSGYPGNYSKGLPHDATGAVDPAAYRALLAGLDAETEAASGATLARMPLGGNQKLVNPLAGAAFDLEGRDLAKLAAPAPPSFASPARAAEMIELYWMALCRDVAFADYPTDPLAQAAAVELGASPQSLFRGFTPGDLTGPYVSQLFLTPVAYGAYLLDGRITTFTPGLDYLADFGSWLACQNGQGPFATPQFDPTARYFRNGRDLTAYVHSDQACEAFYNAGMRLYALNAPLNPGNPYLALANQSPFATFGPPHFLTLQAEAALRAVKAVFRQKWFVHRTLRPEEFGGLVQAVMTGRAEYPLDPSVLRSQALAQSRAKFGSFLHPQAFPEGCPQHPSYTQAHGGVAGACATILKAAFDGSAPWLSLAGLQQSSADGLTLVPYNGSDAAAVTINGEIHKLCGNIALARNFAGVHWRSDYVGGVLLGEAMALSVLADQRATYAEDFTGFVIEKFDGTTVVV